MHEFFFLAHMQKHARYSDQLTLMFSYLAWSTIILGFDFMASWNDICSNMICKQNVRVYKDKDTDTVSNWFLELDGR